MGRLGSRFPLCLTHNCTGENLYRKMGLDLQNFHKFIQRAESSILLPVLHCLLCLNNTDSRQGHQFRLGTAIDIHRRRTLRHGLRHGLRCGLRSWLGCGLGRGRILRRGCSLRRRILNRTNLFLKLLRHIPLAVDGFGSLLRF